MAEAESMELAKNTQTQGKLLIEQKENMSRGEPAIGAHSARSLPDENGAVIKTTLRNLRK